jgi:ribosomal protein S18 acetylase RimI-like enzyme
MTELEARAAGASRVSVLTAADKDAAMALYRAMGFQKFSIALRKWLTEDQP